ncbi:hypothetical protein HMI54_010501 [Coelomomyces lativittatus]|nr:hypothetical protein HMI55_007214 [Coelomomyces lativittatus]KAJ1512861.1 hypothetical protein HMI56_003418 [Coelomomyces lativittatus]KAJ1516182.1 hypothetical protein HMI54_010501 [Coelomomyces lativittatus]
MSGNRCSTGPITKQGQKYKNTTAFHHNKGSKLTKKILALPIQGLCNKCTEIIEWRKKFRKYKPLTVPKKCVICHQKTVKDAYHILCNVCAETKGLCAKCQQVKGEEDTSTPTSPPLTDPLVQSTLKKLSERQRRTFLRHFEKGLVTTLDLLNSIENTEDLDDSHEEDEEDY